MKRMTRQDRVLLESLEDRYGRDTVATVIMDIANKQNEIEEPVVTPQEAVLDYIKYIEGVRIRLRELHWSAERHSGHILTDDIISSLEEFEDNIAEDLMGVFHFRIQVGAIVPKMTNQAELGALLCELHEYTARLCAIAENNTMFAGIVNELEDMMHKIAKWEYLATFK